MKCPASGCGLEWDDFNHIKDHDCLQALIDFEQTENTRLKAQVGRLREALDLAGSVGMFVDNPACRTFFKARKAVLSDTDGEAWLNEERAKVWDEAVKMSEELDPQYNIWTCGIDLWDKMNAKAKALRSNGGERVP